eukprot:TRINITY_DN5891_c0_g3_i2.p1 TRINITY_DN5891_c0_g3~~TRINITY_DN5891_c0_g3_i2.p1  ORF type:complete len:383 (-),score=127.80 TRINITY_DN5891_c0_g3_i2:230-1378(-)
MAEITEAVAAPPPSSPPEVPQHSAATDRLSVHLANARRMQRLRRGGKGEMASSAAGSSARPAAPQPPAAAKEAAAAAAAAAKVAPGGLWHATEKRTLEIEIQSLREAYARKLAETEMMCDRLINDKEKDREAWFKSKKVEVAKIRAGVVVMQALFERRRRKFFEQMEQEKEEFAQMEAKLNEDLEQMRSRTIQVAEESELKLLDQQKLYEEKLSSLRADLAESQERALRAEKDLYKSESESKRLAEVDTILRAEIDDLQARLQESEKKEELQLKQEQIDRLEVELRRTKKQMQDRKNAEADALRKELMEYVKFIVRILPEEWRERLQPQLIQRLQTQTPPGDQPAQFLGVSAVVGEQKVDSPRMLPFLSDSRGHFQQRGFKA